MPTILTESTFITAAITASKRGKVQYYDVPSTFVSTDVDEDVLMVLKGELATMLLQIAPDVYQRYITADKKGTPVLYVKLQKALLGLMRASLLFCKKLQMELEEFRFVVNPCNPCIFNMETAKGKQLTVIWHIDSLMVSCKDNFKLTKVSCYLAGIYGTKLKMYLGSKHNYLGVDMQFTSKGTHEVSMITYLKSLISSFLELIVGKVATPAADYLFTARDEQDGKLLDKESAMAFHHTMAQLLFMLTQVRQDKQTAEAFLTTRVKSPDKDD